MQGKKQAKSERIKKRSVSRVLFFVFTKLLSFIWAFTCAKAQSTYPLQYCFSTKETSSPTIATYLVFQLPRFTCMPCYHNRCELLPHIFTLTLQKQSGIFSVALSVFRVCGIPCFHKAERSLLPGLSSLHE